MTHAKPTSVSWQARIRGLSAAGMWSTWNWSSLLQVGGDEKPDLGLPSSLLASARLKYWPFYHSNGQTQQDTFPAGTDRPGLLLLPGPCPCCQLPGDAHVISLSFWQTSPSVKCDSSMRLSRSLQAHLLPSLLVLVCLVLSCQHMVHAVVCVVFVSICPLNHNLCEGRSWIFIFDSLAPSTIPGIKKGKYLLIH